MQQADAAAVNGVINQEKIAAGVRMIIEAIGDDPDREGLKDTAKRVARMYGEFFQGLHEDPRTYLQVVFDEQHDEMGAGEGRAVPLHVRASFAAVSWPRARRLHPARQGRRASAKSPALSRCSRAARRSRSA